MELNSTIEKGDWDTVKFKGYINEDAEVHLATVPAQLGPKVIFNFKEVAAINSCGVRAWINFLRDVQKDREVIFAECTPEVISQINMIPNFLGSAKIQSVYAEYGCESCGHQEMHLFVEGKDLPTSPDDDFSERACPKCGEEMEMEEIEEEYFAWLDVG